jgi:SAM-dependent methyltransferase
MTLTVMSPQLQQLAARLGDGLAVNDLYATAEGAQIYDAIAQEDGTELDAMIAATRGLRGAVLDLGCGSGRLTFPFASRGHEVTALDSEPSMLAQLERRLADAPRRLRDRVRVVCQDMTGFDLGPAVFDIVILGTTTITLLGPAQRAATFRAVARHLSESGKFLLSVLEISDPLDGARCADSTRILALNVDDQPRVISVIERVDFDAGKREVAILSFGGIGASLQLAAYVNQPYLLDAARLEGELAEAGLKVTVTTRTMLGSPDRAAVLLECTRRGT